MTLCQYCRCCIDQQIEKAIKAYVSEQGRKAVSARKTNAGGRPRLCNCGTCPKCKHRIQRNAYLARKKNGY